MSADTEDVGLQAAGDVGIDIWGAIMLGVAVATVASVYAWFSYCKWRSGRGRMNSVAAGQLRLAAARGRVPELQLISRLPDFQVDADLLGFTALHAAAVQGHAAAMVWLLQQGADLARMKKDDWRDTTLHYAAGSGSVAACEVLLAWGADPAQANALGELPEQIARQADHSVAANFLRMVREGTAKPLPSRDDLAARYLGAAKPRASGGKPPRSLRQVASAGGSGSDGSESPEGGSDGSPDPTPPASVSPASPEPSGLVSPQHSASGVAAAAPPQPKAASQRRSPMASVVSSRAASTVTSSMVEGKGAKAKDAATVALRQLVARGNEGWGTEGTVPKRETRVFRVLAILTQSLGGIYLVWRALRTLNPGWLYFYSIPFWLAEFSAYCLSFCFVASLYYMIERPERRMEEMLPPERFPHVDIFICTYSEPPEIVEPTAIAALNVNWPGDKLTVHILDDGKRPIMARLVKRLAYQCRYMQRDASIVYCGRSKVKGVPHHAKAGNINSCLLKEGPGQGEFILVLDCDMIVHPDILQKMIGHFYRKKGDTWVPKRKAAFMQTPQDFFNVDASDPMVHCARFFYGPMLQGRDGIGAAPCCGTGVVFRRDILVSIGGQAYGSITEDYNSAMTLMSAGFATMFLNERLSYGMAPDLIQDVMTQRLRWAMGALQILMKDNPLRLNGLTAWQSLLFFEAAAHHYLALSTIFMGIVPIVFLFAEVSPMVCAHLWEFALVFGTWYLCNRLMMLWVHRGTEGGSQELWRGSQMWVWMAPNHVKAIWKVLVAENPIVKKLFNFEIGFTVTKKDKEAETQWVLFKKALTVTWPHLTYYAAFAAGVIYFIVTAAMGWYSSWQIMIYLSAISWGILIVMCLWPPVWTMVPRVETEAGWKICWDPFADPAKYAQRQQSLHFGRTSVAPHASLALSGGLAGDGEQPSLLLRSVQALGFGRRSVGGPPQASDGAPRRSIGGPPAAPRRSIGDVLASVKRVSTDIPRSLAALARPSTGAPLPPPPQSVSFMGASSGLGPAASSVSPFGASPFTGPSVSASPFGASSFTASPFGSSPFGSSPFGTPLPDAIPENDGDGDGDAQQGAGKTSAEEAPPPPSAAASHVSPFAANSQVPLGASPTGQVALDMDRFASGPAVPGAQPSAALVSQSLGEPESSVAFAAAAGAGARERFANLGRVGMRGQLDKALLQSALLTSVVLPERSTRLGDASMRQVSVLLDAEGRIAPATGTEVKDPEASLLLDAPALAQPMTTQEPQKSGRLGSWMQVSLQPQQSDALQRLQALTGAGVAACPASPPQREPQLSLLPSMKLPRLTAIIEGAGEEKEADVEEGGTAAAPSSKLSGSQLSVVPGELPLVAPVRLEGSAFLPPLEPGIPRRNSRTSMDVMGSAPSEGSDSYSTWRAGAATPRPGGLARKSSARHTKEGSNRGHRRVSIGGVETLAGAPKPQMSGAVAAEQPDAEEAAAEKALEDELALEAEAESSAASRVAALSTQLVGIASALSPTSASMLLDQGYSMVVPVLPESIYEHTLAARPNFREREKPGKSYMFLVVNAALLLSLVAGSVLDLKFNDAPSDITGAIGVVG